MKKDSLMINIIRLLLVLACIGALICGIYTIIIQGDFETNHFATAFTALLSVIITYIPNFITGIKLMVIPPFITTIFSVFIFLAMFFGEILNFYERFSWWDSMLHFLSGIIFSLIGYMLFISLNRDNNVRGRLHPTSMVLFAICFSLACGMFWEIFEFGADSLLGMNMQRWQSGLASETWTALQNASNMSNPGLINTMKDIICDTAGTLLSIPILLPMIKQNNRYVASSVSVEELAAELSIEKPTPPIPAPQLTVCEQAIDNVA